MKIKNEYSDVLKKEGYNVETNGAMFFGSLLDEVRALLAEGKTEEEIKLLLPRYYVEDYHFFFEVGKDRYFKELYDFCASKKAPEGSTGMNLETSLLFFAGKFNEGKELTDGKKLLVKTPTSGKIVSVKPE